MALNKDKRGRFGSLITEAAIVPDRGTAFRDNVNAAKWDSLDVVEPLEHPLPVWNFHNYKLNKDVLWELAGLTGSAGADKPLQDRLLGELGNREIIWRLMKAAVAATQSGATHEFLTAPLDAAKDAGCVKVGGGTFDEFDLMLILHMFGDKTNPHGPRPMQSINKPDDYFYTTEAEIAGEIQRRVLELAAGIPWEGNVTGGREKKKNGVWNRYGFYCGCGG